MSALILAAWAASMGLLVNRSYIQASAVNLATDLARYGPTAQWRGVYYRGEKVGFTVSQTVRTEDGFELQEDGRLQMSLLGATTAATIRTTARVDASFALRSFDFSLDPGTGPIQVAGRVDGTRLHLTTITGGQARAHVLELDEPPALMLSLARRLAAAGLSPGASHQWTMFDPATLKNAPVRLDVGPREIVRVGGRPTPAFPVDLTFAGLTTRAWVTDTGEVVREESPLGLLTVAETPERAQQVAVPFAVQNDLLEASAVVPIAKERIGEPRDIRRLRLRVTGADLSGPDLVGAGQRIEGDLVEITDARTFTPGPRPADLAAYLRPEPFIESDAPEIQAEAARALAGITGTRARAEALTRYVNFLLEKKPTVSLPSALEVLRTKVGDCNEHTALYVALARASGIPARIAVGLVSVRNAFYYHAWPEVYIDEGPEQGYWLPVDPTFNQFPADATHLRLARGGLDRQAAILPLIGRIQMTVIDVELVPGADRVIVGRRAADLAPLTVPLPRRTAGGCWTSSNQCRGCP
ncbi:MAG: transglutaminase-like domain-containing protein [Acidobacteriota bacterium]